MDTRQTKWTHELRTNMKLRKDLRQFSNMRKIFLTLPKLLPNPQNSAGGLTMAYDALTNGPICSRSIPMLRIPLILIVCPSRVEISTVLRGNETCTYIFKLTRTVINQCRWQPHFSSTGQRSVELMLHPFVRRPADVTTNNDPRRIMTGGHYST